MVARITGRTPHEEACTSTRTFDVICRIRARRLQWAGHILRFKGEEKERLIYKALRYIHENKKQGDLLVDIPPSTTWSEMVKLASDRSQWRTRVHRIRNGSDTANDKTAASWATKSTHAMTTRAYRRGQHPTTSTTTLTSTNAKPTRPPPLHTH